MPRVTDAAPRGRCAPRYDFDEMPACVLAQFSFDATSAADAPLRAGDDEARRAGRAACSMMMMPYESATRLMR